MPDGWEYHNGLNLEVNDATLDPDRDGLGNLLEYQIGTKANVFDTDGDGLPDGVPRRDNHEESGVFDFTIIAG